MSSLKHNKSVITKSKKILEDAATVNQLTVSAGPAVGPTTFAIPSVGINFAQAKFLLQSKVSPHTNIKRVGDKIEITTNNPRSAVNVLRMLGVAVNIDGTVTNDKHVPVSV